MNAWNYLISSVCSLSQVWEWSIDIYSCDQQRLLLTDTHTYLLLKGLLATQLPCMFILISKFKFSSFYTLNTIITIIIIPKLTRHCLFSLLFYFIFSFWTLLISHNNKKEYTFNLSFVKKKERKKIQLGYTYVFCIIYLNYKWIEPAEGLCISFMISFLFI